MGIANSSLKLRWAMSGVGKLSTKVEMGQAKLSVEVEMGIIVAKSAKLSIEVEMGIIEAKSAKLSTEVETDMEEKSKTCLEIWWIATCSFPQNLALILLRISKKLLSYYRCRTQIIEIEVPT